MAKVKKDRFEDRLERRMKSWKQEQHEKKIFGAPKKDEVVWKIVKLPDGGVVRKPFRKEFADADMDYSGAFESDVIEDWEDEGGAIESESERMQNELEPIYHPTEHDESDDLEAAKRVVKRSKVYDGWFWNGHLNKFERWKESQDSMKTKEYKKWYNRGG